MGCMSSKAKQRRHLSKVVPIADMTETYVNMAGVSYWRCPGIFKQNEERKQFIDAVLHVMSQNGKHNLDDLDFMLYYPLADNTSTQYYAALVATNDSKVCHSLISKHTGSTHFAAFKQLQTEVGLRLGLMLRESPNVEDLVEGDDRAALPPAYPGFAVVKGALEISSLL